MKLLPNGDIATLWTPYKVTKQMMIDSLPNGCNIEFMFPNLFRLVINYKNK